MIDTNWRRLHIIISGESRVSCRRGVIIYGVSEQIWGMIGVGDGADMVHFMLVVSVMVLLIFSGTRWCQ